MTWTTQQRSKIGSVAAISRGAGPLVLMIHGVGLRAEAWGAQIDALADNYRVLAVDMPGHGLSAACVTAPTLADFSDAIVPSLDEPAVIIGHSFGAMIGLDLAIRYPERVRGIAALNAIYQRDLAAKAAVRARADNLDGVTSADPAATLERWFGTDSSPERAACRDWLSAVDPARYRDAYRVFARENGPSVKDLKGLACPALFLTGAREPNSTPEMSRQMAALVSGGRAEVVAGAAHMLPMTYAAEVNASLAAFLKGVPQ